MGIGINLGCSDCCQPGACNYCDFKQSLNNFDWSIEIIGVGAGTAESAYDRCRRKGGSDFDCSTLRAWVCDACADDPFCPGSNLHEDPGPDCSQFNTTIALGGWGSGFSVYFSGGGENYKMPWCRQLDGCAYPATNPGGVTDDGCGTPSTVFTYKTACHTAWNMVGRRTGFPLLFSQCAAIGGTIGFLALANGDIYLAVHVTSGHTSSGAVFGQGYVLLDDKAGRLDCEEFEVEVPLTEITCNYCLNSTNDAWIDCDYCCKYCGIPTSIKLIGVAP